jgi:hypothetical protein
MVHDMEDYGQFIEIDIIIDSNIKKNDDIILPKIMLQLPKTKKKQNNFIIIFINVSCFILSFTIFYKLYH